MLERANDPTVLVEITSSSYPKLDNLCVIVDRNRFQNGGAIAEVLGEHMPTPMKRIGMRDGFGTSGNRIKLLEYFGLDAKHIVQAVHELLSFSSAKKSAARLNIQN